MTDTDYILIMLIFFLAVFLILLFTANILRRKGRRKRAEAGVKRKSGKRAEKRTKRKIEERVGRKADLRTKTNGIAGAAGTVRAAGTAGAAGTVRAAGTAGTAGAEGTSGIVRGTGRLPEVKEEDTVTVYEWKRKETVLLCPNCDSENPMGQHHCSACGTRLVSQE